MAENGQDETALQDEFDVLQDGEAEAGNIEGGAANADESGIEDPVYIIKSYTLFWSIQPGNIFLKRPNFSGPNCPLPENPMVMGRFGLIPVQTWVVLVLFSFHQII